MDETVWKRDRVGRWCKSKAIVFKDDDGFWYAQDGSHKLGPYEYATAAMRMYTLWKDSEKTSSINKPSVYPLRKVNEDGSVEYLACNFCGAHLGENRQSIDEWACSSCKDPQKTP